MTFAINKAWNVIVNYIRCCSYILLLRQLKKIESDIKATIEEETKINIAKTTVMDEMKKLALEGEGHALAAKRIAQQIKQKSLNIYILDKYPEQVNVRVDYVSPAC